jgi:hypothetical protein
MDSNTDLIIRSLLEYPLAGPLGIVVAVLVALWLILMLFAPFFWYGTNSRTRETSKKMDTLIQLYQQANIKADTLIRIQRLAHNLVDDVPKQTPGDVSAR